MGFKKNITMAIVCLLLVTSISAQVFDKNIQKLQLTYQLISSLYVDSVDNQELVEEAIVGMLKSLDPHSVYISADEVAAMNEPLDGSFEGVGIQFNIMDDTLMVVNPVIGGPSEKVGIRAGDRIISIDGDNVAGIGIKNSDVFKYLRGKKGTKVDLTILRRGTSDDLRFVVVRDKIPLHSVEAAYMATPKTAYVKISRFALNTYEEFVEALKGLEEHQFENLILDLRGNGGGYLKAAIDIVDELIDKNKLLVYTEGLNSERREHLARKKGLFEKGNLVVLIDEGSASASEIVSGAVQDWDRGLVVGRRSFGKGLVQRPFDFPDGSMIRLTIAKYYTPAGRCIQKDYENGVDAYHNELDDRYLHGELSNVDSIHFDDALEYKTKVVGRTVYGGGGIMPDVFVAVDTSMYSDYYRDLIASGSVNRMILNYVDDNRKDLKRLYPDYKTFEEEFDVNTSLVDLLIEEGQNEQVEFNKEEWEVSRQLAEAQLKALIARDLFSPSEYFQSINPISDAYQKAVEIVESKRDYSQYLK
ncbi:S41 family peptidase [Carboxylicivirga mesophila]|uniref:S41 family peptidase n=1 Tax=Carboxylicivirga mesophila TaxID=1166478 RepID=A0ABS5K7V0_9BACT|nr:S41 family peptidase [Carboxylicivirga mesophila]MBS2211039.1 S41 family peptidase [Carboxylicivirga mesophila]